MKKDFNTDSVSPSNRPRAGRMSRQQITVIAVAVIIFLVITAYLEMPKSKDISDSKYFNSDDLTTQTEQVIDYLDADNFDDMAAISNEDMKAALTKDQLSNWKDAKDKIGSNWGKRTDFTISYMEEVTSKNKVYAIIEVKVAYENVNVSYTVTFDQNNKLAGLYME